MLLQPGARVGPYEVLSPLGAGGMGEVYRARDTRLGRIVAIKTLSGAASASPEFRARFQREARIVAALSHQYICALYDVGHDAGLDYVVIEYLEGETLDARLRRGAVPVEQAIEIGLQVADALAAAHGAGVVHRDLKPSNIILTKGGAKLLDFGIARQVPSALETDTATAGLTAEGTVLGTLQYMAPEQVRGEATDARTDIFAFGAVLHEMVTGARAFSGSSRTALMVAILEGSPPPLVAKRPVPPELQLAVSRCLAKAPAERWQSARDVAHVLKSAAVDSGLPAAPRRWSARTWIALAALAAALGLAGASVLRYRRPPPSPAPVVFTIPPALQTEARMPLDPFTTISPDARHVAFTQDNPSGGGDLWVRSLDSLEVRALPGTTGAFVPFWSPDSSEIAFFSAVDDRLKAVRVAGGPVRVLCPARFPLGGSWSRDGTILFSATSAAPETSAAETAAGLYRVSQIGGVAVPVELSTESSAGARPVRRYGANEGYPQFLPDGRHFVFLQRESKQVHLAALGSRETTALFGADSQAVYAEPGFLLFVRDGALMAQAFDSERLQIDGDPFRVVENIRYDRALGGGVFSASSNGAIAFSAGPSLGPSVAWWVSRAGKTLETFALETVSDRHRLSGDGGRLAQDRTTAGGVGDIWVFDLLRRASLRLTSSPADEEDPVWSPDGRQVAFAANPAGVFDLYRVEATGGSRADLLFTSTRDKWPEDWSPDGRHIAFTTFTIENRDDIWLLDLNRPGAPRPLVESSASERTPRFSPDGRWLAYRSDRTGRPEIYVQPVSPGPPVLASANGGFEPFWRHDGTELYFISLDNWVMSVPVSLDATGIATGPPVALFKVPENCGTARCIEAGVARDGRFLLVTASSSADPPMTVILNWSALVRRPN